MTCQRERGGEVGESKIVDSKGVSLVGEGKGKRKIHSALHGEVGGRGGGREKGEANTNNRVEERRRKREVQSVW